MTALMLAAVLLTAAAFFAPVFKRIGLGSVVGYLVAGMIIGPSGFAFVKGEEGVDEIMHLAEFGIVLLLFLIGLELRPQRLWAMRADIFGAGTAQVALTTAVLFSAGLAFGMGPWPSFIIGWSLALCSTAFVLQFLGERGHLNLRHGRLGFSIAIFQDLAAIPLIAFIPIFGDGAGDKLGYLDVLFMIGAVLTVLFVGRYVLQYAYRLVAATGVEEGMTAAALLTVVTVTLLMESVGLSAALGAFLAGVLIGGSEYRVEIEANIAPFERILLGVFFTAVGMALDLGRLIEEPGYIFGLALGLMAIKGLILFGVGIWRGLKPRGAAYLAIALAQGGEFAFVAFGLALQTGLLTGGLEADLAVAVTLSIALTPPLFWIAEQVDKRFTGGMPREADDVPEQEDGHVIVAGFGPFGQIPARIFAAKHIPFTALEANTEQINFVRQFGAEVYYGDVSRPEMLAAAQAHRARAIILAMNDPEQVTQTVEVVRRLYPDLPIYARAKDRLHAHELLDLGAHYVIRETYFSALLLSERILTDLGHSPAEAKRAADLFRSQDEKRFDEDRPYYGDIDKVSASARRSSEELERQFREDKIDSGILSEDKIAKIR